MDAAGAQEMLMPLIQPLELWQQTGRDGIDELFRLEDRKGSPLVLAMTHEEAMTFHASREVRSYRDLPFTLYQFQTKGRDEPRPRAGVLRTREFIMKDAYSFDRDEEGLARSYDVQAEAYERIFDRSGLEWYMVESDVGMMGGSGAHEFMAPCAAGENEVALAAGYAANVEVASATRPAGRARPQLPHPEEVPTPGATSIEDVATTARRAPQRAAQGDADGRRPPTASRCWSSCAATTGSTRSSCRTRSAPSSARPATTRSRRCSTRRSASPARSTHACPCWPTTRCAPCPAATSPAPTGRTCT